MKIFRESFQFLFSPRASRLLVGGTFRARSRVSLAFLVQIKSGDENNMNNMKEDFI